VKAENKEDLTMARRLTYLTLITLALVAFVASGCSDDSASPTLADTVPPAVPTNLDGSFTGSQVGLSWAPNTTDADFAGFLLARTNGADTVQLISSPQNVTSYADDEPPAGYNLYEVSAMDRYGNRSAYTSIGIMVVYSHHGDPMDE
jgi:hypothetical protein